MFKQWIRLNAEFLIRLLQELVPGPPELAFISFRAEGGRRMASIEVPDTSAPLNASVSFVDAHGHPTTADDVPQWSSDNEAAATVDASEDGLSATVTIVAPGAAIISVSSTNTDGSVAAAQGTVTVMPGDAVIGEVSFEPSAEEPPAEEEPPVEE